MSPTTFDRERVTVAPWLVDRNEHRPGYHDEGESVFHGQANSVMPGVDVAQITRAPDPGARPSGFYPYLFDRPFGWLTGGVNLAHGEKAELEESAQYAPQQIYRPNDAIRGDTARIVPEPWSNYYGFPEGG